jgi:hypothetical protein
MGDFTQHELESFLDEALSPDEMARVEMHPHRRGDLAEKSRQLPDARTLRQLFARRLGR